MYLGSRWLIGLGLLFLSLLCHSNIRQTKFDNEWPTIPVPENSSIVVVADKMLFNGIPMKTWELKALMKPDELQKFYMTAWAVPSDSADINTPGHLIKTIPGYRVISRVEENYLLTVQVRDQKTASSRALLAISKITRDKNREYILGDGFPALTGTTFINDIEAIDGPKKSRTLIATSEAPLQSVARFYRTTMMRNGWLEITKNIVITNKGGAMIFQRNKEEMNITLSPDQNTVNIVAIIVEN